MKSYETEKFKNLMTRLALSLGSSISDERTEEFFNDLADYDYEEVKEAIEDIAKTKTQRGLPTPGMIRKKIKEKSKQLTGKKPIYCQRCNSTGLVLVKAKSMDKESTVAYRCDCENGQKLNKRIPVITSLEQPVPERDFLSEDRKQYMEYEEIKGQPEKTFTGIVVKRCDNCGSKYYVEYREKRVREIKEAHENTLHLCSLCWVEEGRKRGFWE